MCATLETFEQAWTRLRRPPLGTTAHERPGLGHRVRRGEIRDRRLRRGAVPRADPRIRQPRPDGRLGSLDRGVATGMSGHTTPRRLQRMARDSVITFRCDLAHPLAGLSTCVPPHGGPPHPSRGTGNAPARRGEVRLAVSVSGSDNLLVMVWLRGLHTVDPFEAQLAERFPHLKVSDGTAFLHSRTRMGRLPDTTGRATGYTPFSLPQVCPRFTAFHAEAAPDRSTSGWPPGASVQGLRGAMTSAAPGLAPAPRPPGTES